MRRIFKYPIADPAGHGTFLPEDAQIVSAGVDPTGALVVWAYVDPYSEPSCRRDIRVLLTGDQVPDDATHLITFSVGPIVYHVVEAP